MKIGITCSRAHRRDGTLHRDVADYVRAVTRAGSEAVLLPSDERRVDEVLAEVAAVVVSGGVDVDPARYGGRTDHSRSQAGKYRPERDGFEIALLRATLERGVPTFCICRGMQIASVAFGGTLVEDVRDELGERYTIEHGGVDGAGVERTGYAPGHDVALDPDSALARLVGQTRVQTNSIHHQAVRTPGRGLSIVGRTADGVIEAVEAANEHPFFIGVQWHPEILDDSVGALLFAGLVDAARRSNMTPEQAVRGAARRKASR